MLSAQQKEDLEAYAKQELLTEYEVNSTHNALIPATKELIETRYCTVYTLKYNTFVFNSDSTRSIKYPILPKGTKVAINTAYSGQSNNNLITVHYVKINNVWKNISETSTIVVFIDSLLKEGCMPTDRLLNS